MPSTQVEAILTAQERAEFEDRGYLRIPAALPPAMVAAIAAIADRRHAAANRQHINHHDLIGQEAEFLELVDWPATFPKVWGVLGWNIQCFHTQLIVTPPRPREPLRPWGWHQDNNRMNREFAEIGAHPRVSVKLAYFLSDCLEPGDGSLAVVPGSHRANRDRLAWSEETRQPVGAIEVAGRAGDAVLFDRRLWHAGAPNVSRRTRTVLYVGYSYRWLRAKSAMDFGEGLMAHPPIRRQLLGWSSSANGRFEPTDADVPLREWIRERHGDALVAP